MPNYFANLPAPEIRNALVDFSPVNQGLGAIRQAQDTQFRNALAQKQEAREQSQFDYQRGRDQKQDQQHYVESLAKRAMAIDQMFPVGSPQRAAAHKSLVDFHLKNHPGEQLDPEDMDPTTGPKRIMAQAGLFQDQFKRQMDQAELAYKQAQTNKLNREPAGGEAPSNVREWEYYSRLPDEQKQRYLTLRRAEKYLDTGTQFVQPNPAQPGQNIRTIEKNPGEVERQKQIGEAQGKKEAAAPSDVAAADTALEIIGSLRNDPKRQAGTGLSSLQNKIPATPGYDYQAKVNQATSGAFLTAIQQLRGMGALSNAEGQTATAAVTRMDTALSEEAFMEALNDYEALVRRGREKASQFLNGPQRMDYNVPQNRGGLNNAPSSGAPRSGFKYIGPAGE